MFGQSLLSAFGSAVACTTDTDQLFTTDVQTTSLATYQLNNATTSIPSNTYPGTANNITYAAGKFGNAAVFNGSNADIDLPATIDSTTMSISFWIYIDSIVTGNEVVIELENGYGVWFLSTASGKLGVQNQNANYEHVLSNAQLSAGSWHHVAAVWTGVGGSSNRTFYLDNVVQTGGTVADYLTCNGNTIGSRGTGEFFDGKLDQVRIFNKALDAGEVLQLYNEPNN